MKTALVTGAAGFIGRHFADLLDERGYSVDAADITTGSDAFDLFREETWSYDLVVHAAAKSPHRAAIDGQPDIFAYNVMLDAAMFDWVNRTQPRQVLYFSSSAVYPVRYQNDRFRRRLCESMTSPIQPDATYGWTKFLGERLAAATIDGGVQVTTVRPFSGYGEDQSDNFPFRAIIERVKRRDDPLTIWGSGEQVRDWIHVDDAVRGALALLDAHEPGPVNLCTGVGVPMRGLASIATRILGYAPQVKALTDKPAGVQYRVGDPTWLHSFYAPSITLEDGVKRALA